VIFMGAEKFAESGRNYGRLVLVLDARLDMAGRMALQRLMGRLMANPEVTLVAGLHRRAVLAAQRQANGEIFYNTTDHVPLAQAASWLPWREVWLLYGGMVWQSICDKAEGTR
jgi:hypothetical protein